MLVHPSAIDLSTAHLCHLTRYSVARRSAIGCRWRRLTPGRQALLVPAHLRCGDTYARLAAGFGIGIATVYRYICEAIDLLAELAPLLADAMRAARRLAFVILDGTLLPIDRIAADTPYPRPGCLPALDQRCLAGRRRLHGRDPARHLQPGTPAASGCGRACRVRH